MAASADYAKWIIANADKRGTPDFDTVAKAYQAARAAEAANAAPSAPAAPPVSPAVAARVANDDITKDAQSGPSFLGEIGRQVGNLVGGSVRGAGSIGATLMYPVDKATDLIKGDRNPTLGGLVTGQQPISRNEERRQAMDWSLRDLGADPTSPAFKVAKLGTEVAGTAGAGGVVANTLGRAAPVVAEAAPSLLNAIRTGGAVAAPAGAEVSPVVNGLTRVAGGAINGGVSAGLVDPGQAGYGSLIGGALPGVTKVTGTVGNAIGKLVTGPGQTPELAAAVDAARKAGYVIPPSQANPNLLNRVLEGVAGKASTAQAASARNAATTNSLVAKDIGLPDGTTITPEALDALRSKAGEAYAAVAGAGKFNAAGADLPAAANVQRGYDNLTLAPKAEVDARDLVTAWKKANADKNDYYAAYGRSARPEDLAQAKTAAANANAIHDFLKTQIGAQEGKTTDELLADVAAGRLSVADLVKKSLAGVERSRGAPGAVDALDTARAQIAKTYNVEKALNPETGTVSAVNLAKQAAKGKPLSGGLDTAASFAARFPKAAQTPEAMGSLPGTSPLDWWASLASPSNLLSVATLGVRPGARYLALSPVVQNRLARGVPAAPTGNLLSAEQLAGLGYRVAPSALSDR